MDVITSDSSLQGWIRRKGARLVVHVEREAVEVTPPRTATPIEASFLRPTQRPVKPFTVSAFTPKGADASLSDRLERAQVRARIEAVLGELQDRIADELARAVIGEVAAALDLVDRVGQALRDRLLAASRPIVYTGGMLAQQQRVRDLALAALEDELALEVPDFRRTP